MARSLFTATGTLGSSVANNGTITLPYPAGTTQSTYTGGNIGTDHQLILNDNDAYKQSDGKISTSFGGGGVTITNTSGVAWAVGTPYRLQLALLDVDAIRGSKTAAISAVTSGAGTPAAATVDVGASFNQSTLNNNFATLVAQIEKLRSALQAAGVTS